MDKRIPPLPPDGPSARNAKRKMTDEQRAYFKREFKVLSLSAMCYLFFFVCRLAGVWHAIF